MNLIKRATVQTLLRIWTAGIASLTITYSHTHSVLLTNTHSLTHLLCSELYGKIMSCSIAKEMKYSNQKGKAVWNADEYIVENEVVNNEDEELVQESLVPQE